MYTGENLFIPHIYHCLLSKRGLSESFPLSQVFQERERLGCWGRDQFLIEPQWPQAFRLEGILLQVPTSRTAGKGSPALATGQSPQSSVLREKSRVVSPSFPILCNILQAFLRGDKRTTSVSLGALCLM